MKIFIGCSSSYDIPKKYKKDCEEYLKEILKENDLVFGGDKKGLMELSYNIAKENNRQVTSVVPKAYVHDLEKISSEKEIIEDDIFSRTKGLIENSDASIFLPGGIGTLYEFLSLLESKRSHEFNKPIILYNSNDYYDDFIKVLTKIYREKFTKKEVSNNYHISNNPEDTLEYLNNFYFDSSHII